MHPDNRGCLVEACCEEDSYLSKKTRWSRHRKVVPITEAIDFTSKRGVKLAMDSITSKYDCIWLSCPCTGGSMWVNINWARGEHIRQKV